MTQNVGELTIAVVGDAMISRRMRAFRELHFLKLVDILGNARNVSIANLEFLFHGYGRHGSGRVAPLPARIPKTSTS